MIKFTQSSEQNAFTNSTIWNRRKNNLPYKYPHLSVVSASDCSNKIKYNKYSVYPQEIIYEKSLIEYPQGNHTHIALYRIPIRIIRWSHAYYSKDIPLLYGTTGPAGSPQALVLVCRTFAPRPLINGESRFARRMPANQWHPNIITNPVLSHQNPVERKPATVYWHPDFRFFSQRPADFSCQTPRQWFSMQS